MTEITQCPYRCECWLEYVGWWNPSPETCEHETRCDTDTCPRYQKMHAEQRAAWDREDADAAALPSVDNLVRFVREERERKEKEAEPCGQS